MNKNLFHFKQFSINDNACGMKICTDSVLFGAWLNADKANEILDIGTGSGLISLMLAQKTKANITAIEICKDASYCAKENFKLSKWENRLEIINISLEDFINKFDRQFDMIVCNPPWFNSIKPKEHKRLNARHRDSLDYETLIRAVLKLLIKDGSFSVVLPYSEKNNFSNIALLNGLYLINETQILTTLNKQPKRVFLSYSLIRQVKQSNYINLYDNKGNYSTEYKQITKDFYL